MATLKIMLTYSYYLIRVVFFEFEIFLKIDPNSNVRGAFYIPTKYICPFPPFLFRTVYLLFYYYCNLGLILLFQLLFLLVLVRVVLSHTLGVFSSGPNYIII